MAAPADEFERILEEARSRLDGIRLELPTLEDGTPRAPSASQWAAESLAPPPRAEERRERPAAVRRVRAVPDGERPAQTLRSVEAPPAVPAPQPAPPASKPASPAPELEPARSADAPGAAPRVGTRRALLAAALLLAAGGGIWWGLPREASRTLPLAAFDAIAARGSGEWLVARKRDLLLYGAALKPRLLDRLPAPMIALFWTEETLYGCDGKNTLFRWERLDAPAQTFSLDHVPLAIYARPPHVWTLDGKGLLRQFLLAHAMTGVFLQPLDLVEIGLSGDFAVDDDGSLLLLERLSGQWLSLARDKHGYAVTARGPAYGAGARLLASSRGPWIARADGERTSLVPAPPLRR